MFSLIIIITFVCFVFYCIVVLAVKMSVREELSTFKKDLIKELIKIKAKDDNGIF